MSGGVNDIELHTSSLLVDKRVGVDVKNPIRFDIKENMVKIEVDQYISIDPKKNTVKADVQNTDYTLMPIDTQTTFLHIRFLIVFLQDYYCLSDISGKRPPKEINEEVYTGIYFVMQSINNALAYEIERLEEQRKASAKPEHPQKRKE